MRGTLVFLIAFCPLSAAAQDNRFCRSSAGVAARQAVAKISKALGIEIPSVTSESVVNDIAKQVCDTVVQPKPDKIKKIASTVSSAYFENAVKLGKSTEIATLVDTATNGTLGLGLDDLRRYGTLTVSCAYRAASVEVRAPPPPCHVEGGSHSTRVTYRLEYTAAIGRSLQSVSSFWPSVKS